MIIQGSIVVLFISALLFIGNSLRDTTYLRLEKDLKSATKRYVRDYNIKPKLSDSIIISVDDLLKEKYIKENPNIDKYCIDNVTMFRGLFMNEYKVHGDCEE